MEYIILALIALVAVSYAIYLEKKHEEGKIPFK